MKLLNIIGVVILIGAFILFVQEFIANIIIGILVLALLFFGSRSR
jgi:hypothetical protein